MPRISKDLLLVLLLAAVVLASASDLMTDMAHGVHTSHVIQEGVLLCGAFIGLLWLLLEIRRTQNQVRRLRTELDDARQSRPADAQLADARHRLSEMMAEQFSTWQLSHSEKEIGLLLLKGLSLKEIALLRGTTEKTVRQQASAIYQKAGISGRHAFAAWFIEDFL